jgi:hypothetical protein
MPPIDIATFRKRAENPALDKSQLQALRENAARSGGEEYASIVDEVLARRFPPTRVTAGSGTPTTVTFLSAVNHFDTGKEAYLWLIEQLRRARPDLLENYETSKSRKENAGSRFSTRKSAILPKDSKRLAKLDDYATPISDGWYADVNLDHDQKFSILVRLAGLCGLQFGKDWDFAVTGATRDLAEHQRIQLQVHEILKELGRRQ